MDCEQKGHMSLLGQGSSELVGHFHLPVLENLEAMCLAESIIRQNPDTYMKESTPPPPT